MANTFLDTKISSFIEDKFPEFVRTDHPVFVEFLRLYYEFMESAKITMVQVEDPDNILLENAADTGDDAYLIQETYIVGDADTDKTAQNELFDTLDDTVLDFSESNPFGDAGST